MSVKFTTDARGITHGILFDRRRAVAVYAIKQCLSAARQVKIWRTKADKERAISAKIHAICNYIFLDIKALSLFFFYKLCIISNTCYGGIKFGNHCFKQFEQSVCLCAARKVRGYYTRLRTLFERKFYSL